MKIGKRKEKTNNSIKQLLGKLKRHDTMVVAIAVVIALLLCGGLIYLSTPVVAANAREEFEESEKENNKQTADKLQEIHDYLMELDKVVTDNQKSLSTINKNTSNNSEKETNTETKTNTETQKIINDTKKIIVETEKISNTLTERMDKIDKELSELHTEITDTFTKIEEVEKLIESKDKDRSEQIAKGFADISAELDKIQKNYNATQKDLRNLIDNLAKTMQEEHAVINENINKKSDSVNQNINDKSASINQNINEKSAAINENINSKSKEINNNIDSKSEEISNNISNALNEKYELVSKTLNEMSQRMEEYNTTMLETFSKDIMELSTNIDNKLNKIDNSISEYNKTINNKFENINNSMESDFSELKDYMGEQISSVNTQLGQVFRYVSKGKELLASTLLTKGVSIRKDATFLEISRAIESIKTEIVIDELYGEIEYQRHYHTDGKGNDCDDEMVDASRKGGCFTEPSYHEHKDSCYEETVKYAVFTGDSVEDLGTTDVPGATETYHKYHCKKCGGNFTGTNPVHKEVYGTYNEANKRPHKDGDLKKEKSKKTICNKKPKELEGYKASCGFLYGQITGATIDFTKRDATGYVRASNVATRGGNTNALDLFLELEERDLAPETGNGDETEDTQNDATTDNQAESGAEGSTEGSSEGKNDDGAENASKDNSAASSSSSSYEEVASNSSTAGDSAASDNSSEPTKNDSKDDVSEDAASAETAGSRE